MHVGFDLLFLIPGETGGRETYTRELIAALFAIEPSLRATAFVNRDVPARDRAQLADVMRVVRLPVSARQPGSWALGELGLLPVAGRRAGIDLLHSPANFGPASGRFRRVLTLHDLQYRVLPELVTPLRRIGTGALVSLATRRAARIITGSAAAGDELVSELGLDRSRVTVIPDGVAPPRATARASETELRARYGLGQRTVTLTVSSNLPHKNLPMLMPALAAIDARERPVAIVVGTNTDDPGLRSAAAAAGVIDDVRLLGHVSAEELEGLFGLAGCLVLTTRYEGFGLPPLEAMIRDLPVVCSDIPSLREVTGNAALRFPPDRPEEAARAISRVLGDAELARELSAAGRRRAAHFTWGATAAGTLTVYREVLGAGAAWISG